MKFCKIMQNKRFPSLASNCKSPWIFFPLVLKHYAVRRSPVPVRSDCTYALLPLDATIADETSLTTHVPTEVQINAK